MSSPRPGSAGATRPCPHCRVLILESASICPACRHHLRFDGSATPVVLDTPLNVEGTISYPADGVSREYTIVVAVRDVAGREVSRHVVGVGAMQPGEQRSFSLAVEVVQRDELKPGGQRSH